MDSLHSKGLITDPHGRAESVHLTKTGMLRAKDVKELADRLFG